MKLELNENTLNLYLTEAIRQELNEMMDEDTWWKPWTWGRDASNRKWNYHWDDSKSAAENKRLRDVNKANIRAAGYNNAEEYEAGTGHRYGEEPVEDEPETQQEAPQEIPSEYPYKNDRTVTGKYKTGQFQTWFNQNMGGRLVVDGIWGQRTEAAYQQWLNSNSN
jgi:hypothetical protein